MGIFEPNIKNNILKNNVLKKDIIKNDNHNTGIRHYSFLLNNENIEVPSVTAIISKTGDKKGLENWKERIGYKEAEAIKNNSGYRGTVMHRLLEIYYETDDPSYNKELKIKWLYNKINDDNEINSFPTKNIVQGTRLFFKLLDDEFFVESVSPILLEQQLFFYKKFKNNIIGYAGTVDFIGLKNDVLIIIDFKTARKSKTHVDNYKYQIAAYVFAFYYMTGYWISKGEVWISNEMETEEGKPQKIKINEKDIKSYFKSFVQKCIEFNNIIYK